MCHPVIGQQSEVTLILSVVGQIDNVPQSPEAVRTFSRRKAFYYPLIFQSFSCQHPDKMARAFAIAQESIRAFLLSQQVKNMPIMPGTQEMCAWPLDQEDPLEKEMATTPILLPEKSHGYRSLVDYSPLDCKELDMTEQLNIASTRINTDVP